MLANIPTIIYAGNKLLLNNSLQIHQRERKGLETKLCPYLPQYLIYLLILNIHKVITPGFREINDGFAVVQDCIPDGFLYVRKRWLYLEVQAMAYSHCKSFLVYEETDGHIHVNLVFLFKFFPLCLELRQPGVEE